MIVAIIVLFLICYLLAQWSSGFTKKLRNVLVINIAVIVFYNIIVWGCASLYWHGGDEIIPVLFDVAFTVLHLAILLILIVTRAVREQNRRAEAAK